MAEVPMVYVRPTTIAHVASLGVLITCTTTYVLYVFVEHKGPAWLPMLSDTFVPAPGNYISRVTLSVTAVAIGALGAVPYFHTPGPKLGRQVLLGMSSIAAVCLGIVGAVCESDNVPSCMGDMHVHDATAIGFFGLYDAYMLFLSVKEPVELGVPRWRRALMLALVFVSIFTKIRFAVDALRPPSTASHDPSKLVLIDTAGAATTAWSFASTVLASVLPARAVDDSRPEGSRSRLEGSPSWVAALEYTDVLSIMAWLWTYLSAAGRQHAYGILVAAPAPVASSARGGGGGMTSTAVPKEAGAPPTPATPPPTVLARVSVAATATCTSALAIGVVLYTFVIALHEGVIHPERQWPMISDLWVHKPSNMLSRYFVCLGGCLGGLTHLGHYCAVRDPRKAHPRAVRAGAALGVLGAAALCGVGAVNEHEDNALHDACAVTFFGATILWAVVDLATSVGQWLGGTRALAVVCLATSLGCKLAQLCHFLKHGSWRRDDDLSVFGQPYGRAHGLAVTEWTAFVGLIGYFFLSNHAAAEKRRAHFVFVVGQLPTAA